MKHSTHFNLFSLFFLFIGMLLAFPVAGIQAQALDEPDYALDPVAAPIKYNLASTGTATPTVFITASAGSGGNIDPVGTVSVTIGDDQAFTITPDADDGYQISDVIVDGESVLDDDELEFNKNLTGSAIYTFTDVQDDHTIRAEFVLRRFTITATAGPGGSITPSGAIEVVFGSDRWFLIQANEGYQIKDVLVDGITVGEVPLHTYIYTFEEVQDDHTIEARFEQKAHTITATASVGGSITPSGEVNVAHGSNQAFAISPDEGYHIDDVLVDEISIGAVSSYVFFNVTKDYTIHADFAINTYTLIYKAGENGVLTGATEQTVEYGQDGTPVEAHPYEGHHFVQWSDGRTDNPRTDINVTDDLEVTAEFAINTYTLIYIAGENGSLTGETEQTVTHGQDGTPVEAHPDEGYHFVKWSDGVTDNPRTDTFVTEGLEVMAEFAIKTYTITATAGNFGAIEPKGEVVVAHGSNQTFEIIPDDGYQVSELLIDGEPEAPATSYTFVNVTDDHSIHVEFALKTYTIQASASAGGSIDPEGDVAVVHGHNQVFAFTPDAGYVVENILIDDISIGAVGAYTFVNVTSDHRIHAQFGPVTYTITFEVTDTAGEPIDDAVISIDGEAAEAGEYVFALVPGTYDYVVSRTGYFDATGEVELTDQDVTETVELIIDDTPVHDAEDYLLKVYPNPATDRVTIESGLVIHRISIIDMLGQVVYEERVENKQHEISLSGLIDGLYFLRIDTGKGVKTLRVQVVK